jgi:2-polyprenyl-3-methyl-5-hydroxy-6-metoxy-1,4-benzoquinol methylase
VSRAERDKWDERYRSGAYEERAHPTALLAQWLPRLPRGRALDVACGAGRNALYLTAQGFSVDALDISAVGLERAREDAARLGLEANWLCADLEDAPDAQLPGGPYDLIVWVRYVNHALLPHLAARLAPGGHLLCEQHLATSMEVVGPKSLTFRLQPEQLLRMASALHVVHYHEGLVVDPDGRAAALAQLIARTAD